jgi:hypothetical protein
VDAGVVVATARAATSALIIGASTGAEVRAHPAESAPMTTAPPASRRIRSARVPLS